MKIIIVLIIATILCTIGCSSTAKNKADKYVKPLISKLIKYHTAKEEYPEEMDELFKFDPSAMSLKLSESSDAGRVWTVHYKKVTKNEYIIFFNHVHYDVKYKNGQHQFTNVNYFR
ncbi:hypothetical protein QUF90_20980 [Desulfococcaceae bacterium HSG9]|nr:hypothetical protein [Desulfococcaceae bacterium HSG9]